VIATAPLAGLRVLVTRPAHQAAGLCRRIEAAGGVPVRLPMIDIAPPGDPQAAQQALDAALDADWLIFTSANAVDGALALRPALLDRSRARIGAIGPATAAALARAGRSADLAPIGDFRSETLLQHPDLAQVAGRRVVVVRGESGRALLGDTLQARGALLTYAGVYRRVRPAIPAADVERVLTVPCVPELLVFTSPEALANLFALVPEGPLRQVLRASQVVVVSEAMVKQAEKMAFVPPPVQAPPDESGLVDELTRWAQRAAPPVPPPPSST
jgi:uroporphyrinogen-III synthase